MGYSTRWRHTAKEPKDAYKKLAMDATCIFEHAAEIGIALGDAWRKGEPIVTEKHNVFNGSAVVDQTCATFYWPFDVAGNIAAELEEASSQGSE